MYHGDIRLGDTIDIKFTTRQISGAPFTLAGSPVISAYVGNGITQITAGITLTVDFDGVTGLNNVRVVASGANGYATATNVQLVITTGTVNSVSVVGEVIGTFSIEARSAVMPTTAARTLDVSSGGEAGIDWANVGSPTTTVALTGTTVATTQKVDVETIKTNPVVNGGTLTFPSGATLASTTNITAGTITTTTNVTNNVNAVLTNGAHGGTSATITAERIIVASTTSNEPAMKLTGNGTGAGLRATGGATGSAFRLIGGSTSGSGMEITTTLGHGISIANAGTAMYGISIDSGGGDGIFIMGGGGGDAVHFQGNGVGHGLHIQPGSTGDGIKIDSTSGHGVNIAATGTSKHGMFVTGGNGGTSDGIKAVAGTGGVPIRGDITGNLVGTVSTLTTYTGNTPQTGDTYALANGANGFVATKADTAAILVDTAEIGAAGAGLTEAGGTGDQLTALPWNAAWDADVQSEVTDALNTALTEAYRSTGATGSVAQLLYEIIAHLGESAIISTTKTLKKLDGSTTAKTYTLDDAVTPTSISETT